MLHHMLRAAAARAFNVLDPYFQYVTMLLHGDGTNGAQNNTFLDSSTNAFSITRSGNATQGTFTPYGSNWSNYFDGTGDYLTIADNAALELSTSSFTMEWWSYPTTFASNQFQLSKCATSASTEGFLTYINTSGVLKFNANSVSAWDIANDQGTIALNLNAWNHCAISRSGSSWRVWVNGVSSVTITSALGVQNTATAYSIGGAANGSAPFLGYMSNTRIVIGSYVYDPASSTLTIPTSPLTAITNTQLLTCQSNRFLDTSSNAFTITNNGDTSVQRFSPFSPTTAYSTSVIGGSGYFDGSGDYLSAANNAAYNLNSVSFTVECWIYWNSVSGEQNIVEQFTPASGPGWTLYKFAPASGSPVGTIDFYGGSGSINSAVAPVAGQWYHLAISRDNSTGAASFYVNGTRTANATFNVASTAATELLVGVRKSGTTWFNGYMEDLRIVKGSYVYNPTATTITVPTAPLTAITNTSLLLNYTNAGILDNAMMNDLETVGNAQISTSVKKYGTGSMYFDGTGDYLTVPSTPNLSFTGNFTVEAWLYLTSYPSSANAMYVCDFRNGSTSNFGFGVIGSAGVAKPYAFVGSGPVDATGATSLSLNTWYHIAMVRSGSTVTYYLNGVSDATFSTSFSQGATGMTIGARYTGATEYVAGYIDDLRITKGVARYTTTFTPPTAAFPNN